MNGFSIQRLWAIMRKEFFLMKRDTGVIIVMAIMPLILVCLNGYAVNLNPKHVPTVVMDYDNSNMSREFIQGLKNTGYFSFVKSVNNAAEAYQQLRLGKALLIITFPLNFGKQLVRKQNPALLFEDGTTDVLSTSKAIVASSGLEQYFLAEFAPGTLNFLKESTPGFHIVTHRLYDPDHVTQYHLIPGMIGMVLMLTMLMITSVIAFRDIQDGTIEYLLVSPTRPAEILLAEILSYIVVGYVQLILGLILSYFLFHVPFLGSLWLLLLCTFPYIVAELSLGLTIATFCTTQFQAVQVHNLFIALSIILTGFVFPIFAMPYWAQSLSNFIPLTHFLRILHGIILKGNNFSEVWQSLWPLLLYSSLMIMIAINRFKKHVC